MQRWSSVSKRSPYASSSVSCGLATSSFRLICFSLKLCPWNTFDEFCVWAWTRNKTSTFRLFSPFSFFFMVGVGVGNTSYVPGPAAGWGILSGMNLTPRSWADTSRLKLTSTRGTWCQARLHFWLVLPTMGFDGCGRTLKLEFTWHTGSTPTWTGYTCSRFNALLIKSCVSHVKIFCNFKYPWTKSSTCPNGDGPNVPWGKAQLSNDPQHFSWGCFWCPFCCTLTIERYNGRWKILERIWSKGPSENVQMSV